MTEREGVRDGGGLRKRYEVIAHDSFRSGTACADIEAHEAAVVERAVVDPPVGVRPQGRPSFRSHTRSAANG